VSDIALIFPPLVDTNFGSYFPSTAVLAGYVETIGFSARQLDLNEDFAEHILSPAVLDAVRGGVGPFHNLAQHDDARVAARLLRKVKPFLFDSEGRHDFSVNRLGYLLQHLASAFRVDAPLSSLFSRPMVDWPLFDFYDDFFRASNVLECVADCKLVGISVPMGPQLVPAFILSRFVKAAKPSTKVILGGPAVSLMAMEDRHAVLVACPFVDAFVRFDGELPLGALLRQAYEGTWNPAEVGGTSSVVAGRVHEPPPTPGLNLEDLPFPVYDPEILSKLVDPELGVIQARGCYWGKCTYCDFVELYEGSPRFRTRRVARFVDEIEHQIITHGARRFAFITEAIPPGFARRVAEEIRSRGLRCAWNSFAMVDHRFDRELLRQMAESGCEYLCIGIETMTDRVLALVEKAANRDANIRFLTAARDGGIKLLLNLIPDLPSTTLEEALDSLNTFREYRECFTSVSVFPFEPTRSSEIGRNPKKFFLILHEAESTTGQAQYASNHLKALDPAMTREERIWVHRQFRTFAAHVNASHIPEPRSLVVDSPQEEELLEVLWTFLDIHASDAGGIVLFNCLTRRRFEMEATWIPWLNYLIRDRCFTIKQLASGLGNTEHAKSVVQALVTMKCVGRANTPGHAVLPWSAAVATKEPSFKEAERGNRLSRGLR
jgi:radical SAM superfamily enzyme YgiQ (UPF0313 family)